MAETLIQKYTVDETFTNQRGSLRFPLIYVQHASQGLAYLLNSFPDGEVPLAAEYEGRVVELKSVALEPILVQRLIDIFGIYVYLAPKEKIQPTCLGDLTDIEELNLLPLDL